MTRSEAFSAACQYEYQRVTRESAASTDRSHLLLLVPGHRSRVRPK